MCSKHHGARWGRCPHTPVPAGGFLFFCGGRCPHTPVPAGGHSLVPVGGFPPFLLLGLGRGPGEGWGSPGVEAMAGVGAARRAGPGRRVRLGAGLWPGPGAGPLYL